LKLQEEKSYEDDQRNERDCGERGPTKGFFAMHEAVTFDRGVVEEVLFLSIGFKRSGLFGFSAVLDVVGFDIIGLRRSGLNSGPAMANVSLKDLAILGIFEPSDELWT
jgi:hypothetical protein